MKTKLKKVTNLSDRQKRRRLSVLRTIYKNKVKKAREIVKKSYVAISEQEAQQDDLLFGSHLQFKNVPVSSHQVNSSIDNLSLNSCIFTTSTLEDGLGKSDEITRLRKWAIVHKVKKVAVTGLLKILHSHHCFQHFPKDYRSLLRTPRKVPVTIVEPGEYCHVGLQRCLESYLQICKPKSFGIGIQINVDGLPLYSSTSLQFWPILGSISGTDVVFPIGIYVGKSKPADVHQYLEAFVEEAMNLTENGFIYLGNKYTVNIDSFICDTPARAYICNIKGHTGYYCCGKCQIKGRPCDNRVVYTELNCEIRTNEQFRNQTFSKHHNGTTPLTQLPIDLVQDLPFEYMHLVCLGVTRKILLLWMRGKPGKYKLHKPAIDELSDAHLSLVLQTPIEFTRKPRSLWEIDRWKATELRMFLLYTGPLILKYHLPEKIYSHFMCFSVAVRILATPNQTTEQIDYADNLLRYFVYKYKKIYGSVNCSYNVHGLIHLSDDVRKHGHLDQFSAFKFENYLGHLKSLLESPTFVLQQVYKRLVEKELLGIPDNLHQNTTRKAPTRSVTCKYCPRLACDNLVFRNLSIRTGTVVILKSGKLVSFQFTCKCLESKFCGKEIEKIKPLFTCPCDSTLYDIGFVKKTKPEISIHKLSNIVTKCVNYSLKSKQVIFPLVVKDVAILRGEIP